jgi:hypothetical protein
MWLDLCIYTYRLFDDWNEVNSRLLHNWPSSYLNHQRAIPNKDSVVRNQSVQGAILQIRGGPAPHVRGAIVGNQ